MHIYIHTYIDTYINAHTFARTCTHTCTIHAWHLSGNTMYDVTPAYTAGDAGSGESADGRQPIGTTTFVRTILFLRSLFLSRGRLASFVLPAASHVFPLLSLLLNYCCRIKDIAWCARTRAGRDSFPRMPGVTLYGTG